MATLASRNHFFVFIFLAIILSISALAQSSKRASAAIPNNPAFKYVKGDAKSGLNEYKLNSNGLTVLLQEKHSSPVITVMVMYKVGSRNEAVGYTGSTHFLEHMMFKGTPNHDPLKHTGLDDILKPMGGVNNASTSYDKTDYYEVVPSSGLSACLDLESDRMRHTLLRSSDRQSEMTVVRNELERGENTASNVLENRIFATAFREHPYHHPTIGWRSDVEGVPIERLRQFYNDFYYPNNATLILIGDFKTDDTLKLIDKYFAKVPASPKPFPSVYTVEPPQEGERWFTEQRGDELPKLMMAYHIPNARNKDTYALEVLASILGDQRRQSSRLYKKLIDTGLASQASASNISMRDPGLFTIFASANSGIKLETIEKTIQDELVQIAKVPPTEKELDRARKSIWKRLKLDADDPAEFAEQLSEALAVADWPWITGIEKDLNAVTAAQVQAVAKKYFAVSNRTVGFYTPKKNAEEQKKAKPVAWGFDLMQAAGAAEVGKQHAAPVKEPPGRRRSQESLRSHSVTKQSKAVIHAQPKTKQTKAAVHVQPKTKQTKAGIYVQQKTKQIKAAVHPQPKTKQTKPGIHVQQKTKSSAVHVEQKANPSKAQLEQDKKTLKAQAGTSASVEKKLGLIASKTRRKILANGLTVYVLPVRGSGIVAVSAKIKGGQNVASASKTLVPELTGEMLDKGSVHLTKDQLADALETMGSSFDPSVESFWTSIDSEVVTEDLDRYLTMLSEVLREPLFKPDELQKLKKQKESSLKDQMVETFDLAENKLLGVIYKPGCVYNQISFDKQLAELPKITVADLKDFFNHHYTACNTVLAIVGDLTEKEGFALAEKHFGSLKKGTCADLSTAACKCDQKFKIKTLISNLPDKSNVDIILGFPANVSITSKDFCAAQLANSALGHDTLASRLAAIREKHGLSYDIHSSFAENAEPWAPWTIQLSVNPKNVDKALSLVNGIVSDYVKKGMTAEELATEKQRVAGEYLVYRMRTPKQLADALSKYGALGMGPDFMDRYPSMLKAVTLQEANAAISKYMDPGNLVTSLAGTLPPSFKNKQVN